MAAQDPNHRGIMVDDLARGRRPLGSLGGVAEFAVDANGNVTGLVGPDGVVNLSPLIPEYLSLSMPTIIDDGSGLQASYIDFGTDGTGSVTAQYTDAAYLGNSGVKLSWSSGGTYCRVGKQLSSNVIVPEGSVGVFVKWPADQGVGISLYLSNDTGWVNYAVATYSGAYAVPNGWILLLFPQSSFTTYGTFAWNTGVRRFRFSINSSASYPDVYFGGLVLGVKSIPTISISCDDGYLTQLTVAAPILKKYGYTATTYIAGSVVGSGNYCTSEQIIRLQNDYGWDIANHGYGHLHYSTLNSSQMAEDYNTNRVFLSSIGANAEDHFAYPYGDCAKGIDSSDPAVVLLSIGALTGRMAATTPSAGYQIYPSFGLVDRMHIKAMQLGNASNTVSTIKSAIDTALNRGESISLYFHSILDQFNPAGTGGATPADGNTYYKDDFESVISYIKQKELAYQCVVVGSIRKLHQISSGARYFP